MEKYVTSLIACYSHSTTRIILIAVSYKFEFLFRISKCKSFNCNMLNSRIKERW